MRTRNHMVTRTVLNPWTWGDGFDFVPGQGGLAPTGARYESHQARLRHRPECISLGIDDPDGNKVLLSVD